MRVLVVDDDPVLLGTVRSWLAGAGMLVDTAASVREALAQATAQPQPYDVIVLDVMLGPGRDGFDGCRELREARVGVPILMLTARDAVPDRVRGLEAGADDYLVKPFALEELEARIRALSRRHLDDRSGVLRYADVTLDPASRRAEVDGRPLALTRKETALLSFLLLHPEAPQSHATIVARVWGYSQAPASNLVDQYAARLRRKLVQAGSSVSVEARRGLGYCLLGRRG